jgi:hypothetical protein
MAVVSVMDERCVCCYSDALNGLVNTLKISDASSLGGIVANHVMKSFQCSGNLK